MGNENNGASVTATFLCTLIMLVSWIAGVVIAGGWLKLVAIFMPFYAWYLFVERLMVVFRFI